MDVTHEASELIDTLLPCVCGQRIVLANVKRHYDRDGDVTYYTGNCNNCDATHTVYND